jgi:hypothetical protein
VEFPGEGDQREKAARRADLKGQKRPDHLIKKNKLYVIKV